MHIIVVKHLALLIAGVNVLGILLGLLFLRAHSWLVCQVVEIAVVILVLATQLSVVTLPSTA